MKLVIRTKHALTLVLAVVLIFGFVDQGKAQNNVWTSSGPLEQAIANLAIAPDNGNNYAVFASGDGDGNLRDVYKSVDNGDSWQMVGSGVGGALAVSPDYVNDQTVFAAGSGYNAYKSTDGGNSWVQSDTGLPNNAWWDLAISPNYLGDQTIFACGNSKVYKSTDGGTLWMPAYSGLPVGSHMDLAISPNYLNDHTIFVGTFYGVYKSTDGGGSWLSANVGIPSSDDIYGLVISPDYANDETVFAGVKTRGIYKSTDGGANWSLVYSDAYVISEMAFSPNYPDDGTIFAGTGFYSATWYGVVMSENHGSTWSQLGKVGIPSDAVSVRGVAVSSNFTEDRRIFIGTWDGVWTTTIPIIFNTPPLALDQSVTTDEDTTVIIDLTATDVDGDPLIYSVVSGTSDGSLSGTAPSLTYTPNSNFNDTDSFTFKANDGKADSNVATVTITVNPVNDAPVADDQPVATDEDTAVIIDLTATDVDGDPLTYSIVSPPAHGSLDMALTYTPNSNFNDTDSFTFKANDGKADSNVATVTITVNPVNDAPVAQSQSVIAAGDTPLNITLMGSDVDSSTLTYSVVSDPPPSHGTLSGTAPNLTYTSSDESYSGPDSFTFKVNDGTVDSNSATVSITVDSTSPTVSDVLATPSPAAVGTAITLAAIVDDSGTVTSGIVSARYKVDEGEWIDIDGTFGGISETVEVNLPLDNVSVPGVYTISVEGTDAAGNSAEDDIFLVIYDPDGGSVSGSGWIMSPAGAYIADPALEGQARFGLSSKYQRGANTPSGRTRFKFRVADMNFVSTSYEWLVVAGSKAMYKGLGTSNRSGNYGFMLSAIDADVNGNNSGTEDKFRIKIWDKENGDAVVYDNQMNVGENEDPTTVLGGGKITIRTAKTAAPPRTRFADRGAALPSTPTQFRLLANYPNPFNPETWLPYELAENGSVAIRVYSASGQLVRLLNLGNKPAGFYTTKSKAAYWDGKNEAGEQVSSGAYFYIIQAGKFTATKKMVVAK